MKPTERNARRLFNYIVYATVNEDPMNQYEATGDNTLLALMTEAMAELRAALQAGSGAPVGQGFDPELVAVLSARIAGHAYALARNADTLNAVDLPKIAERIEL